MDETRSFQCPLCGRVGVEPTDHHLVPKSRGGGPEDTVPICRECHNGVHALLSNKELPTDFYTVERLLADTRVARHVAWVARQVPGRRFSTRKSPRC